MKIADRSLSTKRTVALATVAVATLVYAVFWFVATPRLGDLYNARSSANTGAHTFTEVVYLHDTFNSGTITGVAAAAHGVELTGWHVLPAATAARDPHVSDPSSTIRVQADFRVTDCDNPTYGWIPVTVHLQWLWLKHSETIVAHGEGFPDAGDACLKY